jgi:hypothetical protein
MTIWVARQRFPAFKVYECLRSTARRQRQLHQGGFPSRLGWRLVEVRVSVDEQQSVPLTSAQGEQLLRRTSPAH